MEEGTRRVRRLGRSRGHGYLSRGIGAFRGRRSSEIQSQRGRGQRKRGLSCPAMSSDRADYTMFSGFKHTVERPHTTCSSGDTSSRNQGEFTMNSRFNSSDRADYTNFPDPPSVVLPQSNAWDSIYDYEIVQESPDCHAHPISERKYESIYPVNSSVSPKPQFLFREVVDPETNKWVYGRIEYYMKGRYYLELVKSNCVELPFVWVACHETADPGTNLSLRYYEFLQGSLATRAFNKSNPVQVPMPIKPVKKRPTSIERQKPVKMRPTSIERQKENYKTNLCKFWTEGRQCRFGIRCIFAHGQHELRTKEQNRMEHGMFN